MNTPMEISLQNPQEAPMSDQNGVVPPSPPPTLPQDKFLVSGQYQMLSIFAIINFASQFQFSFPISFDLRHMYISVYIYI